MSVKRINESFKKFCEGILKEEQVSPYDLRRELELALDTLSMNRESNIKAYEIAFQDVIEKLYPDKAWWEVCSLDIFSHLFTERDPEATIEAIVDSIKEAPVTEESLNESPEIKECPVCGRKFAELELQSSRDGSACPKCGEYLIKTDSGEYVKFEECFSDDLTEDMDPYYGSLCTEMDKDNDKMYELYHQRGDLAPADILVSFGYYPEGEHLMVMELEHEGKQYKKVFDFSEFDFGDAYYDYYVLRDGEVPSGWTITSSTLDEALETTIKEFIETLTEATVSDEDREDSEVLRGILDKMQTRRNAALSDKEKAVLQKYNLVRNTGSRNLYVVGSDGSVDWSRPLDDSDVDNDSRDWGLHKYSNGTPSKINLADRARKSPSRTAAHTYMGQAPIDTATLNAHKPFGRGRDYARAADNRRNYAMHQPIDDMKSAIWNRNYHQNKVDTADKDHAAALAQAKQAYDAAVADADKRRQRADDYHAPAAASAQATIDKLLKRNKTESLKENKVFKVTYDSNGVASAVMVNASDDIEATEIYNQIKGDRYPTIHGVKELSAAEVETNTKKGMSTLN